MTISEIKENVKTSDYDFLKTNKILVRILYYLPWVAAMHMA